MMKIDQPKSLSRQAAQTNSTWTMLGPLKKLYAIGNYLARVENARAGQVGGYSLMIDTIRILFRKDSGGRI